MASGVDGIVNKRLQVVEDCIKLHLGDLLVQIRKAELVEGVVDALLSSISPVLSDFLSEAKLSEQFWLHILCNHAGNVLAKSLIVLISLLTGELTLLIVVVDGHPVPDVIRLIPTVWVVLAPHCLTKSSLNAFPIDFNKGTIISIPEVVFHCFSNLTLSVNHIVRIVNVPLWSQHVFEQSLKLIFIISCESVHVFEDMINDCLVITVQVDVICVTDSCKECVISHSGSQFIIGRL